MDSTEAVSVEWQPPRGKRGPVKACADSRERRRRIRIASYYWSNGLPARVVAAAFGISERTVRAYAREILTYPDPDAARIRSILEGRATESGIHGEPSGELK